MGKGMNIMANNVYLPNGSNRITAKEFLDFYEMVYFYENPNLKLENEIVEIKNGQKPVSENLITIFRWKMGTENYNDKTVTNRWNYTVDIEKVKGCLDAYDKDNPQVLIDELLNKGGLGPVYAITVLYFLSGGQYPIYDKYAHMAVCAIEGDKKPRDGVSFSNLSDSKNGKKVYDSYNDNFVKKVKTISNKENMHIDITNRKLDRALWAYGHLFYKISNKHSDNSQRGI